MKSISFWGLPHQYYKYCLRLVLCEPQEKEHTNVTPITFLRQMFQDETRSVLNKQIAKHRSLDQSKADHHLV